MWAKVSGWIRWGYEFILAQWHQIDADHRRNQGFDGRIAIVLLAACLALALQKYFGHVKTLTKIPDVKVWLEGQPYSSLYPRLYWAGFKTISYFLIPAFVIKVVLKENVVDHGWRLGRGHRTWALYAAMMAIAVVLALVFSSDPGFLRTYPRYKEAGESLFQFGVWELAYGYQFVMLEFFFRGFLLFALARHFGAMAIFVMLLPYSMIHYGKPFAETLGSILGGAALGTIALRTGSIYGGILAHCVVGWSMDIFALARKGQLLPLFM